MTRLALVVAVAAAGVTAAVTGHHNHKRPVSASSATPAPVLDLPRVSRDVTRLPLRLQSSPSGRVPRRSSPRPVTRPAGAAAAQLNWHGLALCESTDNPRAVDPTGTYFGLYQFDEETWYSVGGVGNPADASRAEQTLRARILYGQRGRAPWPVCGVHL